MPNWENTDTTLVLLNRGGVFSVAYQTYEYSGGAHGGESVTYRNFETATGKQLTLTDLFQPNYTVELTKIAERYFRKQFVVGVMNEKENAKLGELGFWFDSNMNADESVRFALNDNFCLTREGLRFTYNQYEITAYAVGMPEFCIPYSELRTLAKAGSVLETLTK